MNTLAALHEDAVNRILYFVPTCRLLIHFELTCLRFQSITKAHMRTMRSVDLLQSDEYDGPVLTSMLEFICERFSNKLTKLLLYDSQDTLDESLAVSHPQLFPRNMRSVRCCRPIDVYIPAEEEIDDLYMQLYRGYSIYSPWIGKHTEVSCDYSSYKYWITSVMLNANRELYLQDFASVSTLKLSLQDDQEFGHLTQLTTFFRGLKQVDLIVEMSLSLQEASELKNVIESLNIKVFLERGSFLNQECREILGRYFSKYGLDLELDHSLSSFVNLKVLSLRFNESVMDPECLQDVPSGVQCLTLSKLCSGKFELISKFLKTHGREIQELEINAEFNAVSDENKQRFKEQTKNLIESICDHCDHLTSLKLTFWPRYPGF
ncbi:hypothetical protein HDE_10870 [Halotydeus destructor]|nr:hypothetical protein HDE_10870 [Halotydeus destructor]